MKSYYTLVTRRDGKWYPQFGDYSKAVVKQEQEDSYSDEFCKIIKTGDKQLDLIEALKKLNGG